MVANNFFCHYKMILVCDVYLIKLLLNNQKKLLLQPSPYEILAMPLFQFEYTAITKIMLNPAILVKFCYHYSFSFAGTVNLALASFYLFSSMLKQRDGVVARASALRLVDLGFISLVESYQKTLKNSIHSFPA